MAEADAGFFHRQGNGQWECWTGVNLYVMEGQLEAGHVFVSFVEGRVTVPVHVFALLCIQWF